MYTFWDFPFLSNFQQLDFQGLPCFFFYIGDIPFHFQGLPCFLYTFGDFPFHFQGLPCLCTLFGTSHSYHTFDNFIFKDFLVIYILWGLPLSFSRTSLFVYTFWDFPFLSNFQQLHFQGLPCLYMLWGLPLYN